MNEEDLQIIMPIITCSGNSISCSMEAMQAAAEKHFEEAEELLQQASDSIKEAHVAHMQLLVREANNNPVGMSLLLVHASDHLTNAEISLNFAQQIIMIHKELKALGEK